MTDIFSAPPVTTQITKLGYRHKDGKTDLVVGFRCFGEFNDNTKVELFVSQEMGPPNIKVTDFWEPTLRNTQGFFEQSALGPVPFQWPLVFEPIDDAYINGEHLDNLDVEESCYLAFCTLDWGEIDRITLVAVTTLDE